MSENFNAPLDAGDDIEDSELTLCGFCGSMKHEDIADCPNIDPEQLAEAFEREELLVSPALLVHAECPECGFSGALERDALDELRGVYFHGWNRGEGAYRVVCPSCAKPFVIKRGEVHDVQHTALTMLGEA